MGEAVRSRVFARYRELPSPSTPPPRREDPIPFHPWATWQPDPPFAPSPPAGFNTTPPIQPTPPSPPAEPKMVEIALTRAPQLFSPYPVSKASSTIALHDSYTLNVGYRGRGSVLLRMLDTLHREHLSPENRKLVTSAQVRHFIHMFRILAHYSSGDSSDFGSKYLPHHRVAKR
ncbi:hypothetical protein DL93DRAFT_1583540 [Clavulina sp. PMI_390]|nr:hypothetical protein DL93DRAFT_1583540 [Clavulina sp. PMI_390]